MIKSKIVKINKIKNFDNRYIENTLSKMGFELVRWAIVSIDETYLEISVSHICLAKPLSTSGYA